MGTESEILFLTSMHYNIITVYCTITILPLSWFFAHSSLPSRLGFLFTFRTFSLSPHHCLYLFVAEIASTILAPISTTTTLA